MKKFIGILILLCSASLFAETFSFPYSQIPFGKSMEEVLAMCDGATIKEDEYGSIDFVSNYSLSLFSGSTYSMWGSGCYLATGVTKTYIITDAGWKNIEKIKLYFVSDFGKKNYTLMMVAKYQKKGDVDDRDIQYKTLRNTITKSLNITSYDFTESYNNIGFGRVTALCSKWNDSNKTSFLFVEDMGVWSNSTIKGPLIVYVNNNQVNKYMTAQKLYESDRQKKKESKVTSEF